MVTHDGYVKAEVVVPLQSAALRFHGTNDGPIDMFVIGNFPLFQRPRTRAIAATLSARGFIESATKQASG
jgi:hypothetical protein